MRFDGYVMKTQQGRLRWGIYSERLNRLIYSINLMGYEHRLYEHEYDLSDGRFRFFRREVHPYAVSIDLATEDGDSIERRFVQMVEWAHEFAADGWSFRVEAENVGSVMLTFSFADEDVAALCRLTWG